MQARRRQCAQRIRAALGLLVFAALAAGWRGGLLLWVRRDHLVGIDVSHHQGEIDWRRVRAEGISFAFIKATEGATFLDPAFPTNWSRARTAGLIPGAYHFFTFCATGRDQASNFAAAVPSEAGALPPLIDLEFEGNCSRRPSLGELRAQLEDFLRVIEPLYRTKVIFYVTEESYAAYGALTEGHELFVRGLFTPVRWLHDRRWRFRQFDDGGRLDGIEAETDLDAFQGSLDDLRALAGAHRSAVR